jgi:hypothetical protein
MKQKGTMQHKKGEVDLNVIIVEQWQGLPWLLKAKQGQIGVQTLPNSHLMFCDNHVT